MYYTIIISFVRSTSPITFQYLISSIQLERVSSIKDLDIFFSFDLTFNFHFISNNVSLLLLFISNEFEV